MADYDKDMAEERIQIKDDKKKIYEDDRKKRDAGGKMYPKQDKAPKTFEGGAHRGEMKHDKEGNHLGPKAYPVPKSKQNPKPKRYEMDKDLGGGTTDRQIKPPAGPKQYDDYGAKGHGAHSKDYGARMTADPQSYRSSMSKHWSGSNSRFLTEGGDVIDQTAQRDSM